MEHQFAFTEENEKLAKNEAVITELIKIFTDYVENPENPFLFRNKCAQLINAIEEGETFFKNIQPAALLQLINDALTKFKADHSILSTKVTQNDANQFLLFFFLYLKRLDGVLFLKEKGTTFAWNDKEGHPQENVLYHYLDPQVKTVGAYMVGDCDFGPQTPDPKFIEELLLYTMNDKTYFKSLCQLNPTPDPSLLIGLSTQSPTPLPVSTSSQQANLFDTILSSDGQNWPSNVPSNIFDNIHLRIAATLFAIAATLYPDLFPSLLPEEDNDSAAGENEQSNISDKEKLLSLCAII